MMKRFKNGDSWLVFMPRDTILNICYNNGCNMSFLLQHFHVEWFVISCNILFQ